MTTPTTVTPDEALRELIAPNPTADGVADVLRAAGITGKQMDGMACPVAKYLTARTGQVVSVGGFMAYVGGRKDEESFELPDAVRYFTRAFDLGRTYEDLRDGPLK